MAAKDLVGLAAGLALAAVGLGAFLASSGDLSEAPAPVVSVPVAASQPARSEVVSAHDASEASIPGLAPSVAKVLAQQGFAFRAPGDELPPATRRVLLERGAVLTVDGLP